MDLDSFDSWLFGPFTTSRSIWKHLCSPTWCSVWTWWCPIGCGAPGQVPSCPYGLCGLVVWTMILQYVDHSNLILIYLSMFLVNTRKQELFTVWVAVQFTWTMLGCWLSHRHEQHWQKLIFTPVNVILAWTVPVVSESETEAASKLAFHFKSDVCFFCPLKVWMKSGAVHSSAVQQAFTENSHSPVSMLSHQNPLTFVPLPSHYR